MVCSKQVDKEHYNFSDYMSKKRWVGFWHQIDSVVKTDPDSVLEVGGGSGILKTILVHLGFNVTSVDIDDELGPDVVASVLDLPLEDRSYRCVCAYQVLEHLPYNEALQGFKELCRVSSSHVIISLPHFGSKEFVLSQDSFRITVQFMNAEKKVHEFDGEHYWEIGKVGYPLNQIMLDFSDENYDLEDTYRVPEYPYHRFFVYKRNSL